MTTSKHCSLLILGSGPAGWTAAVYAARANLKPVVITGMAQGGQLMTTTEVDNWPGDAHGLMGPALMERMQAHAERFDTEVIFDQIHTADLSQRPFRLKGDSGEYTADALIIATGATAKYLGLESEQKFMGRGVSACATCDGFFFKDMDVAVIGGGNTAVEEALYLAEHRAQGLHRASPRHAARRKDHAGQAVRQDPVRQDRAHLAPHRGRSDRQRCRRHWAEAALHAGREHADHRHPRPVRRDRPHAEHLAVRRPAGDAQRLPRNPLGLSGNATQTSVPGVFAAGDVADQVYRQAVTSAGFGCMAALDAEKFLDKEG
jgi:thioredoxin reductase (NADPH)